MDNEEKELEARFGAKAEPSYDEETEANMVVRLDLKTLDRIVSVQIGDPLLVAN